MADSTPKSYHTDPTLWLYTSLTAGSSSIITATSRLELLLKANNIPFLALDVATDEKARMLWGRRAAGRKLPGLVRMGMIIGDYREVEEWNEYGELKDRVGDVPSTVPATPTPSTAPSASNTPSKPPPSPSVSSKLADSTPSKASSSNANTTSAETGSTGAPVNLAVRSIGFEAAKKAGDMKLARLKAAVRSSESSDPASGSLKKLDDSASIPPPSGITEASSAKAPETDDSNVASKADLVPPTSEIAASSTTSLRTEPPQEPIKHRGSSISFADPEVIRQVEKRSTIAEEPEEIEEEEAKTEDAAASDERKEIPGTGTQEQSATSGEKVEESVAD